MSLYYSHSVYSQLDKLIQVQKRRSRIIESMQAHFGKTAVSKILVRCQATAPSLLDQEAIKLFAALLSEQEFLRKIAFCVFFDEAVLVQLLRTEASPYPGHADEQILFASRNAGQDTGRLLISKNPELNSTLSRLFQGLDSVWFRGLPEDKHSFVSIRPLGHISIYWEANPHLEAWQSAKADASFQENIEMEWIHGILDILSPNLGFVREFSLAKGDSFGLSHLIENRRLPQQTTASL